jgi:hypothetical protein
VIIDVYLRCAPQNWIRGGMAISCLDWWCRQDGIRLHLIMSHPACCVTTLNAMHPCEVNLPLDDFHWASRSYADEHAKSTPYVVADDDRLPIGKDWLERALGVWERHPDYAMLCPVSYIPVERPNNHEGAGEVFEANNSCGAPYFAAPHQVPYDKFTGPANQQDQIVCEWMRLHNVKHGWMRDIYNLHLGFGHSQVGPWGVY